MNSPPRYRLGLIGSPSRICKALAPVAFGLLIEPMVRGWSRFRRLSVSRHSSLWCGLPTFVRRRRTPRPGTEWV